MIHKAVLEPRYRRERRRGVAMVYFALSLIVIIGMVGFVTDLGRLYVAGAQAQKAADAAALAGAPFIYSDSTGATSRTEAQRLAKWNGFDIADTANQVTVTSALNPDGHANWHRATVSKRVPLYFMPILGLKFNTIRARATAQLTESLGIPIQAKENYGKESVGNVNLSMFGPYGLYSYGDAYSPKYLDDGSDNPRYTGKGYDFDYIIGSGYSDNSIQFQIFDPDCYNKNGDYVDGKNAIDEIRTNNTNKPGYTTNITKTRYTLYTVNANGTTGTQIAQAEYGGDSSTDMKWVTPTGFTINDLNSGSYVTNSSGNRLFRINITTIDGSSENAFDLRAGKVGSDGTFDVSNTSVNAVGRLPINFNADGNTTLSLANVPKPPDGFPDPQVIISKYDTDVGSKDVNYTVDPAPTDPNYVSGKGYAGKLSSNGQWLDDKINLPAGYQGGNWAAVYTAGANDTSVWEVKATFPTNGSGSINLVQ